MRGGATREEREMDYLQEAQDTFTAIMVSEQLYNATPVIERAKTAALIAIGEMLADITQAGTIQVDATLWNGSHPIQITEDDGL